MIRITLIGIKKTYYNKLSAKTNHKATSKGFYWQVRGSYRNQVIELSVIGQLSKNWYINSGIGYQQAKVHKDKKTPANEGKYLSNTAKHSGNLGVRYLPHENWFTEVEFNYKESDVQ